MSKMKSKVIGTTVTNDDQHMRLRIYDGDIPINEAGGELLRLALDQHHRISEIVRDNRKNIISMQEMISSLIDKNNELMMPWPIRWYKFFFRG